MLSKISQIFALEKKTLSPKRTPIQKKSIRPKCRKLTKISGNRELSLVYFGLSNTELSGNAGYYTSEFILTSDEVKTKRKSKFEKKIFVWVAFSHISHWPSHRRRCLCK